MLCNDTGGAALVFSFSCLVALMHREICIAISDPSSKIMKRLL